MFPIPPPVSVLPPFPLGFSSELCRRLSISLIVNLILSWVRLALLLYIFFSIFFLTFFVKQSPI